MLSFVVSVVFVSLAGGEVAVGDVVAFGATWVGDDGIPVGCGARCALWPTGLLIVARLRRSLDLAQNVDAPYRHIFDVPACVDGGGHTVRRKPSACTAQCVNDIGRSPT